LQHINIFGIPVRLFRPSSFLLWICLFVLAAGAAHGQVIVTLGSTGCGALQAAQTCTLSARVSGTSNFFVNFTFSPNVAGASTSNATGPDVTGLSTITYRAPNFISARTVVTATATSISDPSQSASVFITLVPITLTIAVSPSTVTLGNGQTQQFTATVSGVSQTGVTWSINPQAGTIDPISGFYTAPTGITANQKVTVTATSNFDPTQSGTATITLSPIGVTVTPATVTLGATQSQQFTATVAGSQNGVTWSISPAVGTITNTGLYTAPTATSAASRVTVIATSIDDPSKTGTATITLTQISITVTPATITLNPNQSQQFAASLAGSQAGVTWSISPQVGTITSTGLYTAPSNTSAATHVTVTATSIDDPGKTGTATITLAQISVSVTPSAVTLGVTQLQQFQAVVQNSTAGVSWSISPQAGTIDQAGLYIAPSSITANTKVTVTASSLDDPAKSGTATITLQPPPSVGVTIAPASVTLGAGQAQQFTATLSNSTASVTWSISPTTAGSIDSNGFYTAPSTVTAATKVTVTATSTQDPTKTGTATVNLTATPAATVVVTPATVTLNSSQTQQFLATVQNGTSGVTWSISPQVGTIDQSGLYTAPSVITGTQKITVTATSIADSSKTGTATISLQVAIDVGLGAPTSLVQQFIAAYYRNGFNFLVSLPPAGNVKKLGSTGYVQEFNDLKTSGLKDALVTISSTVNTTDPNTGIVSSVVQILGNLYTYYNSVGANTAGYPLSDGQNCPGFDPANNCQYAYFDKSYVLFSYGVALATGQNFAISAGYYTEWVAQGGITGLGRPVDVVTTITAVPVAPATTGTTASVQTFANGAIYTITSGPNKNKVFGVSEPMWDLYVAQLGPTGTLGLPTSESIQISNGVYQQTFEGGSLKYGNGGPPVVQLPVASVGLIGAPSSGTANLNLGQTLAVTAAPVASTGAALTDRPVSWSTTNGKVISIQASGQNAVLLAIGGGTASVTASSGGMTSPKLTITVFAPCCQLGDGAPTAVAQAFHDALTRNRLSIQTPVPAVAQRVGNGYVQMVQSADANAPVTYMLAIADQSATAYAVGGDILARYQSAGGPAGSLGYPVTDQSAGGTQRFQGSAALSGNPVRLVQGAILTKWGALGYEAGQPGPPTAEATTFSTFGANSGSMQTFGFGTFYSATAGPLDGQTYYVTGLIRIRYDALGGASGNYGMPTGDETVSGSLHQQNFEGGNFTYSAGDSAAVDHPAPKVPGVVVAPATITAGGHAHLAIVGFANGATIRVSVTGQPDFLVSPANGAYAWDMAIALTAASGTITIQASDTKSTATARGSLTVRGFATNRLAIAKVQGDNQTGAPGALLPVSMKIALLDSSGTPVVGAPVVFQVSPGASLSVTNTVTDTSGQAETFVRLPTAAGITAVTADVPNVAQAPVSFYARSAAVTLSNFPSMAQPGRKGALVAAVAAILRYHQNRAELPTPNGLADPSTLDRFLVSDCIASAIGGPLCDGYVSNGASGEQVVNLWRAADFTSGVDVTVVSPSAIADLLAQGSPVLLSLELSTNGSVIGGHYVVATGIAADGSFVIEDPNPLFARTSLSDYFNGFSAGGVSWTATIRGAVQFVRRNPSPTRFLMAAVSQPAALMTSFAMSAQSIAGSCGTALDLLDSVDSTGVGSGGLTSRMLVCDGTQSTYQVSVGAVAPYHAFLTDLSSGGSSTDVSGGSVGTYKVTRPQLQLVIASQDANFSAAAVVNAASFTGSIAPGGIISIFGAGLSGPGATTGVDFDGEPAQVLLASPFQINAVVPADAAPGAHTLHVTSAYGTAQQMVTVSAVAPAIFMISPSLGAVVNQNNTLNTPSNPLPRGQVLVIYATGLGTVTRQANLSVTTSPVTVVLGGQELTPSYAGIAPGSTGEYQVNVAIPATTPPGLSISLALKQGGQLSNAVAIAVQ